MPNCLPQFIIIIIVTSQHHTCCCVYDHASWCTTLVTEAYWGSGTTGGAQWLLHNVEATPLVLCCPPQRDAHSFLLASVGWRSPAFLWGTSRIRDAVETRSLHKRSNLHGAQSRLGMKMHVCNRDKERRLMGCWGRRLPRSLKKLAFDLKTRERVESSYPCSRCSIGDEGVAIPAGQVESPLKLW